MSEIFDFIGNDDFFLGGSMYSSLKEPNLLLSIGRHVDVHFPPRKRSRASAPFDFSSDSFELKKQDTIEVLPDECLFEIFRRLCGAEEKSACAGVSKRWLMLLSNIRKNEFCGKKGVVDHLEGGGYLSRSLEGNKATDIGLVAMSVGTVSRGGLGKLLIRGSNSSRGVTSLGLKAIARGCPSLRVLSLWNLPSIGDEGLCDIANECHLLEKLDLCHCPGITDKALLAVAKNCPNLTDLTIESCPNIGNEGLQAVAKDCPNLKQLCLRECAFLSDNGLISIGKVAKSIESLQLEECHKITQCGFFGVLVSSSKLKAITLVSCFGIKDFNMKLSRLSPCRSLRSLIIHNCPEFGNASLALIGKLCPRLKHLELSLLLGITDAGLLPVIENCEALSKVNLSGCLNLTDKVVSVIAEQHGLTLEVLNINCCRQMSDASLVAIADNCFLLSDLDVSRCSITDVGIAVLASASLLNLEVLSVSGCSLITDKSLPYLEKLVDVLEGLNLKYCCAISARTVERLVEQQWTCDILS